ncbi:MAG TPA: alkaline phosphatase family protein [Gaiellales bacterium]|nr:alkaline phosphatase family protein [Gaiellales bacterium]
MALIAGVVIGAASCGGSSAVEHTRLPAEQPPPAGICGTSTAPPARFDHVIVIVLENHSYNQLVGAGTARSTPYLNQLAGRCGLATDYHSITHPSLPNYLAITGGSTFGFTTDCRCQVRAPSIFSQVAAGGGSWAVYAESMPRPCQSTDSLGVYYAAHHNPPIFYRGLAAACPASDRPLGTPTRGPLATALRSGRLARYVFIAPDRCHDMHDCSVTVGDAWVSWWVNAIVRSRVYRDQSTVVFITVDEGTGGHIGKGENCAANPTDQSCHVPLIVVSRYVPAGTRDRAGLDHYSLMRATAQLTGTAPLGHALTAPDLLAAFHL